MIDGILSLVQPRTASLDKQREVLPRLNDAVAAAHAETERAQDAFDADGSPAAQKALSRAQDAEREAVAYRDRAQRNLAAAEAAQEAERLAALKRKGAKLEEELADSTIGDRLAKAEVRAWLALTDAWLERREHEVHRSKLQHELGAVRVSLGADPSSAFHGITARSVEPATAPIVAALQSEARKATDPTRRERLNQLAALLA